QAGGPDVAIDAALIAQAIGEAGFAQQFVELRLVRRRDLGADIGNVVIDIDGRQRFVRYGDANRSQQRVRQFERSRLGDIETVDEAVADQIEIGGNGGPCFTAQRAQALDYLGGVARGIEELAG